MPKDEHYCVMLGMNIQRNAFMSCLRFQHYYVMMGMKTYKSFLSFHAYGWKVFCDAGHENSHEFAFITCLRVDIIV